MAAKKKKLFFCFHCYREGYLWSSEDDLSTDHGDDLPAKKPKYDNNHVSTLEILFTMPRPDVESFTCVSSGSKIFVIGGSNVVKRVFTDEVYWIDTDTSSPSHYQWEKLPSMNAKRRSPVAAAVDGKIFVIGSNLSSEEVNVIPYGEFLDLNEKPSDRKWEPMVSPLNLKQQLYDADPESDPPENLMGWEEMEWEEIKNDPPPRICFKDYPSVYWTTLHAVDDNKIYVNDATGIPPWNLSYHLKEKAWHADGIPLPTSEPYNKGRNVIVDGFLYLICAGGVWSFPLTPDTTELAVSGLNYEFDGFPGYDFTQNGGFPPDAPKPVFLASLPPDLEAVAIYSTHYLFHLGNGDVCLVMQDPGSLVWCQFLKVSPSRAEFGRLKKYYTPGWLLDCLLVEDS